MEKNVKFVVQYSDDFNRKHITFVKGFSEVKFYMDRFDTNKVSYHPLNESFEFSRQKVY